MDYLQVRDKRRRVKSRHFEIKRRWCKFIIFTPDIARDQRESIDRLVDGYSKNTVLYRTVNRCSLTGKSRWVLRFFGLGRRTLYNCLIKARLSGFSESRR